MEVRAAGQGALPEVVGPQAVPVAEWAWVAVLVLEWAQPVPRGPGQREVGQLVPAVRLAAVGLIRRVLG